MRVLVASPYLFPEGGGLERYAHSIAQRLAALDHDVTLLGHAPEPLDERDETNLRLVGVRPGLRLSNTPLSLAIHREARRLLRETPFDIVHVHTPVPGTAELVALAARRAGVPHAVTYHAGELGAPSGPLRAAASLHRRTFERWLLDAAAARIGVSPYVQRAVFGERASEVVPPGVDADRFRPLGEPEPGRILFVGPVSRAYAWKGLATLFDAFARHAQEDPDATLRIVGDGDLRAHYARRAKEAGLAARVSVVPRVSDDGLVEEYNRASVVVLPSLTPAESFGMVLAEANACARPVIGSDVGGIPSFVRPGENGLLAPPGDAAALAAALAQMLADPERARRMGETGRERVLKEHSWDLAAERTATILEQAASRKTVRGALGLSSPAVRLRVR